MAQLSPSVQNQVCAMCFAGVKGQPNRGLGPLDLLEDPATFVLDPLVSLNPGFCCPAVGQKVIKPEIECLLVRASTKKPLYFCKKPSVLFR